MKYLITLFLLCLLQAKVTAQKTDSIYFHLYTDSLKKGVYNYINVDGLMSNGHYLPLDSNQIAFSASAGKWIGNNLLLDPAFDKDSVIVTAQSKQNPALQKSVTIFIKRKPDDERLKTEEEIMNDMKSSNKKRKRN